MLCVVVALAVAGCEKEQHSVIVPTQGEQVTSSDTSDSNIGTLDSNMVVTDRAIVPPTTGWASLTGYLNDLTTTQTTILALVAGYNGQSSGQSASYPGAVFLTDCATGDGQRMRDAIQVYHNWFIAPPVKNACNNPSVPASVITSMKNKLLPYYSASDQTLMVERIRGKYNAWKCANPNSNFTVPTTDNPTMLFLGIRKQCLEWACTLAGTSIGYSGPFVTSQTSFRRGMGLYKYIQVYQNGQWVWKGSHAMIITDIWWNVTNGVTTATKFKVAESNFGSGWSNPGGQIPWSRVIQVGRELDYSGSPSMKVVNYWEGNNAIK